MDKSYDGKLDVYTKMSFVNIKWLILLYVLCHIHVCDILGCSVARTCV